MEEQNTVDEIKKLAERLGDKATVTQEFDTLKITIKGDWTSGHPTSRPKK